MRLLIHTSLPTSTYAGAIFHPPPLTVSLSFSLWLSGCRLLFYNIQWNGSNVKRNCLPAFPAVAFTIKVFDQFVTGTSDRASALQHQTQQVH